MVKYYYNADGKAEKKLWTNLFGFKVGTSRDCRIVINEAKRHGISYEELYEYKRRIRIWEYHHYLLITDLKIQILLI